jgi:beta-phosphoglucomutase-like phosphatase (HAD superfamily)
VPQQPPLPAAAVFDWDGTIVDTLSMIYRANVVALAPLGITMSRAWFRTGYTPDWRRSYRELGVPEDRWDEVSAVWAAEMATMRPRAMPWARGALRRLRRHGIRVGLVTASTRGVVAPNLARLNLAGAFEVEVYADEVRNGKPHPEGLLRARAAGARFAAVGSTTSVEAFRAAGVERVWPGVGAWADDLLGEDRGTGS